MSDPKPDVNGNYHGGDGRFVSLRDYIERILAERDKADIAAKERLSEAVVEAKVTASAALAAESKNASDRSNILRSRIDVLESGGAPFASRLDESLDSLKKDVEVLKVDMVRSSVLEALREQTVAEVKANKRQIKYIAIAAAFSLLATIIVLALQVKSS